MSMELVCDRCRKPIEIVTNGSVVRGNGNFHMTEGGIYLAGTFRVQRDGKGGDADVCAKCVAEILLTADMTVTVTDGPKVHAREG
jgi:hypothetical protein